MKDYMNGTTSNGQILSSNKTKYYCHIKYDGSQFRYMRSELCLVFIVVFPSFLVGSVKLLEHMISALCLVMFPCLFLVGSAGL